jgi:hypothetical protein
VKLSLSNRHRQQHAAAGAPQNATAPAGKAGARRGQSLVEAALILPLLVLFLSVVIEAGLALNAWIRVNTAARDATRFALDAGRPDAVGSLTLTKLAGIDFGSSKAISGSGNIDIYQISGLTDGSGNIPNDTTHWNVNHSYDGDGSGGNPTVTRTTISNRIKATGSPGNIPFVIVEVDFKYTPLLATLIRPNTKLPMMSYAIIQQQPNN